MNSVSVLIRNRNEAGALRIVLERLKIQYVQPGEIVIVDNESTDESREVAASFQCRVIHLPAGEFTYGRASNLGFENCSGDLVLMLSAHALPIGSHFIEDVTAAFSDPKVDRKSVV